MQVLINEFQGFALLISRCEEFAPSHIQFVINTHKMILTISHLDGPLPPNDLLSPTLPEPQCSRY